MKKLSVQKFSMLGLVLSLVSAVTASVLPVNKKYNSKFVAPNGSLTFGIGEESICGSCTLTWIINSPCNDTYSEDIDAESGTTAIRMSYSDNTTRYDY